MGGDPQLVAATAQQPVDAHEPAHEETMFFKGLAAIFGTGGRHGAFPAAYRPQVIQRSLIERHQPQCNRRRPVDRGGALGQMGTGRQQQDHQDPEDALSPWRLSITSLGTILHRTADRLCIGMKTVPGFGPLRAYPVSTIAERATIASLCGRPCQGNGTSNERRSLNPIDKSGSC